MTGMRSSSKPVAKRCKCGGKCKCGEHKSGDCQCKKDGGKCKCGSHGKCSKH